MRISGRSKRLRREFRETVERTVRESLKNDGQRVVSTYRRDYRCGSWFQGILMTSTELNTYTTFGYLACGVGFLVANLGGAAASSLKKWVLLLLVAVWVLHTGAIGLRWFESYQMGIGHAPLSNLYESLVFFAWTVALALLVVRVAFRPGHCGLAGFASRVPDHGIHLPSGPPHQTPHTRIAIQLACGSRDHVLSRLCGIRSVFCGSAVVAAVQEFPRCG